MSTSEDQMKTKLQVARYERWKVLKKFGDYAIKEKKFENNPIRCFISYAWGDKKEKSWVKHFADDLIAAGIVVLFDQNNGRVGQSLADLIQQQIDEADFILLIGTPSYRHKSKSKSSSGRDFVVAYENQLIQGRASINEGERERVLPLLITGAPEISFPEWLVSLNNLHVDLRDSSKYHESFFRLIRDMYRLYQQDHKVKELRKEFENSVREFDERVLVKPDEYLSTKISLRKTSATNAEKYINSFWKKRDPKVLALPVENLSPITWPLVSNIEAPGNHIIERKEPLRRLEERFKTNNVTIINQVNEQNQVVTGLGGIGKTQLAKYYAYMHRKDYQIVWWCRAEKKTDLLDDMKKLIKKMNNNTALQKYSFNYDGLSESEFISKLKEVLATQDKILLVLDNVEEESMVLEFIPMTRAKQSYILMTSRNQDFEELYQAVCPLEVFNESEAILLLQQYVAWNKKTQTIRALTLEEENNAKELAKELGYLPLAVRQAASYIKDKITLATYLEEFKKNHALLLESEQKITDYPSVVKTTWQMNIKAIQESNILPHHPNVTTDFLSYLAYLAPDNITKNFLEKTLNISALELGNLIGVCNNYSLIDTTEEKDKVGIHRLVQKVIQSEHTVEQREIYIRSLVDLIAADLDKNESSLEKEAYAKEYLSHLEAIENQFDKKEWQAVELEKRKEVEHYCYFYMGYINQYLIGNVRAGAEAGEKSLKALEVLGEKESTRIADVSVNLGNAYGALGNPERAKVLFEKALVLQEKYYGMEKKQWITALIGLGVAYADLENIEKEKEFLEKALVLQEKYYGEKSQRAGLILNNLAAACIVLKDDVGAEKYFARIQEIGDARCFTTNIYYLMHKNKHGEASLLLSRSTEKFFGGSYTFNQLDKAYLDDFLQRELAKKNIISINNYLLFQYFLTVCYVQLGQHDEAEKALKALQKTAEGIPTSDLNQRMIEYATNKVAEMHEQYEPPLKMARRN